MNGHANIAVPSSVPERSARQLLEEFEQTGCQQPFEEIVRRYGGMVFSVCFQVTRNAHDAEDATQAGFLSLAVQLRTGKQINFLGPWLQQVAKRMSMDIRRSKKRRKHREGIHGDLQTDRMTVPDSSMPLQDDERALVVREEVDTLPAKYRLPLILHYFGGLSRDEMAKELKCRENTLGVRLHRGRQMLATKLQKRGFALGAAAPWLLDSVLHDVAARSVTSSVATNLLHSTSHAAARIISGHSIVADTVVSARVMKLARDVTAMMLLARVKFAAASVVVTLGLLAAGATAVARGLPADLGSRLSLPSIDLGRFMRRMIAPVTQSLPSLVDARPVRQPIESPIAASPRLPSQDVELDPAIAVTSWLGLKRSFDYAPISLLRESPVAEGSKGSFGRAYGMAGLDGAALRAFESGVNARAARKIEFTLPKTVARDTKRLEPVADGSAPKQNASAPARKSEAASGEVVILASVDGSDAIYSGDMVGSSTGYPYPVVDLRQNHLVTTNAFNSAMNAMTSVGSSNLYVRPLAAGATFKSARTYVATGGLYVYDAARWNAGAPAVVRGHGTIRTPNAFENNGVVIAEHGTLRIDAQRITNPIDNPVGSRNGWYAQDGGTLQLPASVNTTVAGKDKKDVTATWGESSDDPTLDLVNSVRATFHDVTRTGKVGISLVSTDDADVPNRPKGTESSSIHKIECDQMAFSTADVTIRYDDTAAATNGLSETGLNVYTLNDGQWDKVPDAVVDTQTKTIRATEQTDVSTYFAVGGNPARMGLSSAGFSEVTPTIVVTAVDFPDVGPDSRPAPVPFELTDPSVVLDHPVDPGLSGGSDRSGSQFMSSVPELSGKSSVVPEPASAALIALGAGFLLRRRRRATPPPPAGLQSTHADRACTDQPHRRRPGR